MGLFAGAIAALWTKHNRVLQRKPGLFRAKKLEHPKLNYPFEYAASKSAAIIDGGILTFIDFGKKNDNP
ncbi:hypothetical protein C1751_01855 [Pseudomonas fluorescens]|nr:hypothetical protein C1751_01855 [Pseudomonas fluorescens]